MILEAAMKTFLLLHLALILAGSCAAQKPQTRSDPAKNPTSKSQPDILYVDGATFTSTQAAIDALGSAPGIVVVPSDYAGGDPTSLPDNIAIWDLRANGRLKIITNPTKTSAGSAVGLWIAAGPLGSSSTNPAANDIVGLYSAVRSTGGNYAWGENLAVDLASDKPDANLWGSEIDLAAQGPNRKGQYIGLDVVSSAALEANPLTAAVRAYTASTNAAGWRKGFNVRGIIDCAFCVDGIETGLKITKGISGRQSEQTVTTNANPDINEIFVGALLSVDSGAHQENVRVSGLSNLPYSVTGIFTKNHARDVPFTVYSGERMLEFGNTVTARYPYHLGSLQAYNNSHTPNVLGLSVDDDRGVERLTWFFPAGSTTQTWRDVGGGFSWQDREGAPIATLNGRGIFSVYNGIVTTGTGVPVIYGSSIDSSSLNGNFGPQTIYVNTNPSAAGAGLYRVCVNAWTILAGTGSAVTINVIYDNGAATIVQPLAPALALDTLSTPVSSCVPVHSAGGQSIRISARGKKYGTSVYAIDATVEQLR
jgi:hypothetical protein